MSLDAPDPYSEQVIQALGLNGERADSFRALRKSEKLKFYFVENTSGKRQFVLAATGKFAGHIARQSGHIHDLKNGAVLVPTDKFISANQGFWSAVQRAIRDCNPGVIVQRGNHAVMGDKVYSPLHEV